MRIMYGKLIKFCGGCYVAFAIVFAVAAAQKSDTRAANQSPNVAKAGSENSGSNQRLLNAERNPRRNLFLTIWTMDGCYACEQQKKEVQALRKAGYNVVVRNSHAPRWVKLFPTTVVTKDGYLGKRVKVVNGFKTVKEFDEILLKPAPKPKPKPVPDYHIYAPLMGFFAGVFVTSLVCQCIYS